MPGSTLVTLNVVNSQWMADNQVIFVSDGTNIAHFLVVAQPVFPYTQVQCVYEPQPNDTIGGVGVTIASGASVSPSAYDGLTAYTSTGSQITVPNNTTTPYTIYLLSNKQFFANEVILVGDGTNQAHFTITSKSGAHNITVLWLNSMGDSPSGSTIGTVFGQAIVTPASMDGVSLVTTITDIITLPAAANDLATTTGGGTSIPVISSAPFTAGQYVMASDTTPHVGNFIVNSIVDPTHITLKWLDNSGDSPTGSVIASGAKIVPVGSPAKAFAAIVSDPAGGQPVPPAGYVVTNIVAAQNIGPAGGYAIAANTLQSLGDSIEFEAWFKIVAAGGNKTIVVNWAGTPIFSYGPAAPGAGTFLKITGRIVLTATGPNLEICLVSSIFGTVTTTSEAGVSADPTLPNPISFLLTQTAVADSTDLFYFMARLLPA